MLWPCQMSMLDLKFTPIELLDHEGRTCLGCSSQFGPACHLNNKLQQCLSKHEENSLYLAQIPVIFWLWTRSANDQSNDTVERQRLFCFVREAPWTHIFFCTLDTYWPAVTLYLCSVTLEKWFCTYPVVLVFLRNKSKQNCHAAFLRLKVLLAMKTEQSNESKITIVKISLDCHNSWCHHMMSVVISLVAMLSTNVQNGEGERIGSKYLWAKSDFMCNGSLLAGNVCPAQNAQCNGRLAIWSSGIMAAVGKECGRNLVGEHVLGDVLVAKGQNYHQWHKRMQQLRECQLATMKWCRSLAAAAVAAHWLQTDALAKWCIMRIALPS